ncbi:ADP-ribosylglycohydrolase family protein [Vibrio methylphosphonaticus]|uniref:ADP-ribosylglycohydrolase family protein n=1 Tax=Vibrio methylphosphonaticus TaxID=2946866 RepID=UPI00202A5374|nr:ADP-ribosylglycohydrolase family protein [Vibrio methylphosphonaticus]MCL9773953.1 ADP-ribosylglycohydrolase family protein [Vibrio methylphosphonaticus]
MTTINNKALNSVTGALVADAASMGFHWLYDQVSIRTLSNGTPEFHAPNAKDYIDRGYFAHINKRPGDFSQYGAQLVAMLDAIADSGQYIEDGYIDNFRRWFDFGGRWQGYIDKPTKQTLLHMHEWDAGRYFADYLGADDKQNPALSKLPALVARHYQDPELFDIAESSIRVTNNNTEAVEYGLGATAILRSAIEGKSPRESINSAIGLSQTVDEAVALAEKYTFQSSISLAQELGMHCSLEAAFPLTLHLILNATSYEASIRENILCGGDSCGRAILLGATLGACFEGATEDIPNSWVNKTALPKSLLNYQRILVRR